MKSKKDLLCLASLLHDIGKFSQRADSGSLSGSSILQEHSKDESTFCPVYNGVYSHKHVLWTADFIDCHKERFAVNETETETLLGIAAGHHLADSQLGELGRILKEADCLSSGMDRNSDAVLRNVQEAEKSWNAFKKKRMVSVLETVGRTDDEMGYLLPIKKMNLSQEFFPRKKNDFTAEPDYATLWSDFEKEFTLIGDASAYSLAETLLSLLHKYASHIPASTIDFPDVSLYDHLKTTAAIAVCLYEHKANGNGEEAPFLLIGADFSGIQSYIYQIISKHASKNLKGRSFYLRLMSDVIVRYLLRELELYSANIVYNSGGGFYLLAPNTQEVKERLQTAIDHIEERILAEHGTALFVAIDYVELSKETLLHKGSKHLGDVWGDLFKKREKRKNAKFSSIIAGNYDRFFTPLAINGNIKDAVTGEPLMPNEQPVALGGDQYVRRTTNEQILIGKELKKTNMLVIKEGEPLSYWKECLCITPLGLGYNYYFINEKDAGELRKQLKGSADNVTVVTLNGSNGHCNFIHILPGNDNIYQLDFYGGNEADIVAAKTFEELCKNDAGANGKRSDFERMGVLRMDVDNLGMIFQKGIPAERATLSRYSALSRSFDYFFSGYLNTIWNGVAPEKAQIIYSGGDDVFIVARWDIAIEIAERIKDDFRRYTCGNPAFSLSGGIAIVEPKFPIMKAAEYSADEESLSKGHVCGNASKNSISFMSMPLNWDKEFKFVKELKDEMLPALKSGHLPKSFLSKLMIHCENANIVNHKITNFKTYWMLSYDLGRMKGRYKEVSELIEKCLKHICEGQGIRVETAYHALELWTLAARWAELEYRSNNN